MENLFELFVIWIIHVEEFLDEFDLIANFRPETKNFPFLINQKKKKQRQRNA